MLIRPATPADARPLAEVHITCWREAYVDIMPQRILDALDLEARTERWLQILNENSRPNFVGIIDDEIVGFSSCGPLRDDDATPATGELYGIYLRRHHWGTGRGHQLWLVAFDTLTAAHCDRITLWVLKANHRARRFYERIGFTLEPGKSKSIEREGTRLPEVRYQMMIAPPS